MKYVNLLIKPASSLCNLRCRYCFYEDEAKNRVLPSHGLMSRDTAEALILDAYSAVEPGGGVSFAFQGGEPTVAGLDFFRFFADLAREKKPESVGISFAIQTNGTLLDDDWCEFLRREGFLTGLSVDGFSEAHDMHRVDSMGRGTWSRVLRAKKLLERHGVDHNALCVVTGRVARSPEQAYNGLKKLGFDYIQFIACLDPLGEERGGRPWSLTPPAYGKFLCRVFDLWYTDWERGDYHSVRLFDDYIHILLGDGAGTCATCGKCGAYFVVEGDGSVYPCDFFALDEWKMGKLPEDKLADLAKCDKARAFLLSGAAKPRECAGCKYSRICNGGCKNDWFTDDGGPHNYFCAAFRQLLDYALPRMMNIARAEARARGMR